MPKSISVQSRLEAHANALRKHADAIRQHAKLTVENIIKIGEHLIAAKDIAGHGNWLPWLEREFGWHENTARNYMRLADPKNHNVVDLDIPIKSVYLLTAPSTPQTARDAIVKQTKTRKVTHKEVVKAVRTAKVSKDDDDHVTDDAIDEPDAPDEEDDTEIINVRHPPYDGVAGTLKELSKLSDAFAIVRGMVPDLATQLAAYAEAVALISLTIPRIADQKIIKEPCDLREIINRAAKRDKNFRDALNLIGFER